MLNKDEAVKRDLRLQVLNSKWSYPHQDQQPFQGGLWPKNSKGKAQLEEGYPHENRARDGARNNPGLVGACPSVLTAIRNHFCGSDTLSANLPPATATLSPWFMWYLLMGQGWHQILHSSQRSAWCIWLVGWEEALLHSSDSSWSSIVWKEELKHRKNIKVYTEFAELGENQSSKHTSN